MENRPEKDEESIFYIALNIPKDKRESYLKEACGGDLYLLRRVQALLKGHDIEDVSEYIDHTSEKYKNMVEWIRNDIDVTTLRYQTLEDMVEAVGLPKERICTYCWTGECPYSGNEEVKKSEMENVH